MRNGSFGHDGSIGPGTTEIDPQGLEGMSESIVNGGWLETAMEHAVGTLWVATVAITFPVRLLHQGLETWGVPFLRQQVTGPLPAEYIPRRIAPWGARVGLISRQKVEK